MPPTMCEGRTFGGKEKTGDARQIVVARKSLSSHWALSSGASPAATMKPVAIAIRLMTTWSSVNGQRHSQNHDLPPSGRRRRPVAASTHSGYFRGTTCGIVADWRLVDHGVGVFDAAAVRASLLLQQAHQRVVVLALRPVALPFEECRDRREANRAGLHHPRQRGFLRGGRRRAAAVIDHVDRVARVEHRQRRPGDAHFGPQSGENDVLATGGLDCLPEACVVPGVHAAALHDRLTWEDVEQLWPDVTAERFGLNCGEHGRHLEFLRNLGHQRNVVDQQRALDAGDAEQHLRLMVDEHEGAVLRRVELR